MSLLAVTGAGGFIGLRLVERALAEGLRVRGLDLSPEAARLAREAGAEVIVGDITDPSAAAALCAGADALVHTAALAEEDGVPADYWRVNVAGTRTVAEAARAAGVRRLVHLSSVMVYGFRYAPDIAEDGPLRGDGNIYCDTKRLSEIALRGIHEPGRTEVVIVRPGDVYGPRGAQWVLRPLDLLRRGLFALPRDAGAINHIHVDNLVDGLLLALRAPVGGEIFNLTDGVATPCVDFFAHHAAWARAPLRTLPTGLLRGLLRAGERLYRVAGRPPPARPAAIEFLRRPHAYAIGRARERLGFAPRLDLRAGMAEVERALTVHQGESLASSRREPLK